MGAKYGAPQVQFWFVSFFLYFKASETPFSASRQLSEYIRVYL